MVLEGVLLLSTQGVCDGLEGKGVLMQAVMCLVLGYCARIWTPPQCHERRRESQAGPRYSSSAYLGTRTQDLVSKKRL